MIAPKRTGSCIDDNRTAEGMPNHGIERPILTPGGIHGRYGLNEIKLASRRCAMARQIEGDHPLTACDQRADNGHHICAARAPAMHYERCAGVAEVHACGLEQIGRHDASIDNQIKALCLEQFFTRLLQLFRIGFGLRLAAGRAAENLECRATGTFRRDVSEHTQTESRNLKR